MIIIPSFGFSNHYVNDAKNTLDWLKVNHNNMRL